MIIVFEVLLLALALLSVTALFFRVRCPPDHALVLTNRSTDMSLRSGPPAFQVLPEQGTFRVPSAGAVDLLDLAPVRLDAFVPFVDVDGNQRAEVHTMMQVRVSRRAASLRRAAVRAMGMPRRNLDAIGEGILGLAVRDAIGGRSVEQVEHHRDEVESDVRAELVTVLDELGMEIIDLQMRFKKREV